MAWLQRVLLTVLFVAGWSLAARGDGFIVINQPPTPVPVPPGHFAFAPLDVSFHRVSVEIKDQVAVTSVDEEFSNPNPVRLEGTYLFPLPLQAHHFRAQGLDFFLAGFQLLTQARGVALGGRFGFARRFQQFDGAVYLLFE